MHPAYAEPRTKEEWRAYVDTRAPVRPSLPGYEDYLRMGEVDRDDLNDRRGAFHSALVIIRSERMRQIHKVMARKLRVNAHQTTGARRGVVIDGPPTVGKSTLVKVFAADHELALRRRFPEWFKPRSTQGFRIDYTPVVYLSIPSQATPKDLSAIIAQYLGIPIRRGATKNEITTQALRALNLVGTELIIVDDVHFLDLSAKEGRLVNDHLKYLANHTAATFVYTGHDLQKSGLFLEGGAAERATQTAGRYALHRLDPFTIRTETQQLEWVGIIQAMENTLLLYRHRPGNLAKHWRYLHDRTGGTLAALSDLIREAADEAIETGTEAITKTIMDNIVLGQRAEARYAQIRQRARKSSHLFEKLTPQSDSEHSRQ
jgi:hypothetical protein